MRGLKGKGAAAAPMTVQIRAGKYWLDQTLTFGPQDSGTTSAPVSYVAYKGEKPEIIGGRAITGFKAGPDG